MSDLEEVIEGSLNEALQDDEPTEVATPAEDTLEVETAESAEDGQPESIAKAPVEDPQIPAPGSAAQAKAPADEFSKKFGIPAQSITGKENKIPYSRMKKIVEKNEKDVTDRITATFTPRIQEFETKVQDYEGRLTKVAQFEQVMEKQPREFLGMLSTLPAYKGFFEFVNKAMAAGDGTAKPDVADPAKATATPDDGTMPQPDRELADGSRVYSLDGLKALMTWQSNQTKTQVSKEFEDKLSARFAPIEQERQARDYMAKLEPVINNQIAEAKKWPNFDELEPKIVELLNADKALTLEGAYMKAYQAGVVPKLIADKNKTRAEILEEIRKKPATTGAPSGTPRPKAGVSAGPQSRESVITESLREAGLL